MRTIWDTQYGSFRTEILTKLEEFCLHQFNTDRDITAEFHLFHPKEHTHYKVILGRDVLQEIGLDIRNSMRQFVCDGIEIDMWDMGYWNKQNIEELNEEIKGEAMELQQEEIWMDTKSDQSDLDEVVNASAAAQTHLSLSEKIIMLGTLKNHLILFDHSKGLWTGCLVRLEFKKERNHYNTNHIMCHTPTMMNSKNKGIIW